MFNKDKKIIVFFASIAFMFTSIFPNSVNMGMVGNIVENIIETEDTSASSSSSGDLILQLDDNANNLQNSDNNSTDLNEVSRCEKCLVRCFNCFCDGFIIRHPCVATSLFLALGVGALYGIGQTLS